MIMTELKLKYNGSHKGIQTREEKIESVDPNSNLIGIHGEPGNARNICFILADGKWFFLNYAYLISGEYIPDDNRIILMFTSHIVELKGIFLENLFQELMNNLTKIIRVVDKRYLNDNNINISAVVEILITSKTN
ncbi:MAG: hypothetical protein DWQ44_11235 [Bacteroidetes bacterium]|nr:MAG: hypothetical protein DWQ33_09355 [Bacteroidota bacterium]REK05196.1 MAG: hypothetical protein DWQ39_08365 [Bacteroidota bacterium]REK32601.1 MAG: hypothetical protein DWQ44_11235 [Bacteroidota bacterium]REK48952.1 MAG: hypothetical protein DWQ48_08725 [Bacteroidota bacterium]